MLQPCLKRRREEKRLECDVSTFRNAHAATPLPRRRRSQTERLKQRSERPGHAGVSRSSGGGSTIRSGMHAEAIEKRSSMNTYFAALAMGACKQSQQVRGSGIHPRSRISPWRRAAVRQRRPTCGYARAPTPSILNPASGARARALQLLPSQRHSSMHSVSASFIISPFLPHYRGWFLTSPLRLSLFLFVHPFPSSFIASARPALHHVSLFGPFSVCHFSSSFINSSPCIMSPLPENAAGHVGRAFRECSFCA